MEKLDFSGLNKIAYKGFENPEDRDSLLEAGYTVVSPTDNPFTAPSAAAPQTSAFADHTGSRNYKRLYRIAHDYHQRHNPPEVDREYWRTHTPGEDDIPEAEAQYWIEAARDVGQTATNDPFLRGILLEIYAELEREYKAIRAEASTLKA